MSGTTTTVLGTVQHSAASSDPQFVPKLRVVASISSLHTPKGSANDADIELTELAPTASKGAHVVVESAEAAIPWWRPHAQFASLCWAFYVAGWNDGTTGALLPRIQSHYGVCSTVLDACCGAEHSAGWLHRRVAYLYIELSGRNRPTGLFGASNVSNRVF